MFIQHSWEVKETLVYDLRSLVLFSYALHSKKSQTSFFFSFLIHEVFSCNFYDQAAVILFPKDIPIDYLFMIPKAVIFIPNLSCKI